MKKTVKWCGAGDQLFMSKVKTHTFNGHKYKIHLMPFIFDGLTDIDEKVEYNMFVFANLKTRNGLITLIHEALHASKWKATEEEVERTAKEIGDFLWRLGYRRKV